MKRSCLTESYSIKYRFDDYEMSVLTQYFHNMIMLISAHIWCTPGPSLLHRHWALIRSEQHLEQWLCAGVHWSDSVSTGHWSRSVPGLTLVCGHGTGSSVNVGSPAASHQQHGRTSDWGCRSGEKKTLNFKKYLVSLKFVCKLRR